MRIASYLVVLLACTGCASRAPFTVQTEHGRVHGRDPAEVERVARALEAVPAIRRMLHSARTAPPEVWLLQEARMADGAYGTCAGNRISLARDAFADDDPPGSANFYVAHEVAHWYTEQSPFVGLPHFLHEGLADYVTLEILGWHDARHVENESLGAVLLDPRHLWIRKGKHWDSFPFEYASALTRIGYEVVSRIGLDRLRELNASGTDPLGYLSEAGMTPRIPLRRALRSPGLATTDSTPASPSGPPTPPLVSDGDAAREDPR